MEDTTYYPHEMWATVGDHGQTKFMSFEEGRSKFDAPILIDQRWLFERLPNLEGKILTLLEAVLPKEQQKGAKDVARGFFSELMSEVIETTQTDEYTDMMIRECNASQFTK